MDSTINIINKMFNIFFLLHINILHVCILHQDCIIFLKKSNINQVFLYTFIMSGFLDHTCFNHKTDCTTHMSLRSTHFSLSCLCGLQ